ncbi:EamA family transporter [Brevibacillus composti]|uniref:EamA family transporter n=1 Tax=Brevibacillus composti TaxID=2796470 RepID=A0A7T5JMS6_9BACL|nr:EamA family transporter [Brevibacillus composti]QQE73321.1 EamA family transporter [Brevibacillus composti]QUO40402.1 EamA family transporter [Brevibacillus composti]
MVIINYAIMCLVFGTTFLAIKIGIDAGAPPFFSAGIRFFLAGLVLFLWMVWKKRASFSLLLQKEMAITGLCLTFGTFSTLYWAEQHVTSGAAAILSATGPMMILLIQTAVLREKIHGKALLGCLIGFAGVILLVFPQVSITVSLLWLMGSAAILLGELFYASGALYSKKVIRRFSDASPIALNAAQMMYGGGILLVLSLFTEEFRPEAMLTPAAAGSLLYLIVIGSMVGHTLFYWLVAKTNPVFPSTWLYLSPVIAMGLGSWLYQEHISWVMAAGALTTITGIVIINLDSLRQLFPRQRKAPELAG